MSLVSQGLLSDSCVEDGFKGERKTEDSHDGCRSQSPCTQTPFIQVPGTVLLRPSQSSWGLYLLVLPLLHSGTGWEQDVLGFHTWKGIWRANDLASSFYRWKNQGQGKKMVCAEFLGEAGSAWLWKPVSAPSQLHSQPQPGDPSYCGLSGRHLKTLTLWDSESTPLRWLVSCPSLVNYVSSLFWDPHSFLVLAKGSGSSSFGIDQYLIPLAMSCIQLYYLGLFLWQWIKHNGDGLKPGTRRLAAVQSCKVQWCFQGAAWRCSDLVSFYLSSMLAFYFGTLSPSGAP